MIDPQDSENLKTLTLAAGAEIKEDTTAKQVVGAGVGAGAGALIGTKIGIAALGTAVPGTLPLAILIGVIGWFAAR